MAKLTQEEILSYANSYGYTLKDYDIKQILALNSDTDLPAGKPPH